jgi:hypothetical protein
MLTAACCGTVVVHVRQPAAVVCCSCCCYCWCAIMLYMLMLSCNASAR